MKRTLKPLDIEDGELDTFVDDAGIERWIDGGARVSQGNAFTDAGGYVNVRKMAANAASSFHGTRRITALSAEGVNVGTIHGMSNKPGGSLKPKHFNVFQAAKGKDTPNWATMNKKAKAS